MGMADTNKRINLAAPLISVRRHGGAGGDATALPYYKPGETSGPLGHTGTVPFRWEPRPGHPKSVRTRRPPPPPPPATVDREATSPSQRPTAIAAAAAARAEEEQRFSDARSRDDVSCVTVNCSATGLSDAASACAAAPGSRGGAMMERFLPAAHAVAVASPLSNFRKAGLSVREPARAFDGDRLPMQRRLPLAQHIPTNQLKILSPQDKNEYSDAESDVNSTQSFASSKRCGLLPTRCVKSTLLLLNPASAMRRSRGARRGEGNGGKSQGEMNPLLRRSRSAQQQPPRHTGGHDPDTQSWEELYIKSLLRSARSGLTSPAAAVDRTVRELYKQRGGGKGAVHPKASHLGLLLVLDRSNEPCRGSSKPNPGEAALLLPRTKSSPPHAGNKPNAGGYGFPLLLEDKAASQSPGREIVLSPQQAMLPALPSPKSPSESWLSRALPSVSNRPPPATTFLGLHVHSRKHAPLLPCSSIDSTKAVVQHARQRQIVRFHDLHK
ncbi:hypothetical protein EJB05_36822, partial [Eragrostis curvula]